jgi:hypothetical protein
VTSDTAGLADRRDDVTRRTVTDDAVVQQHVLRPPC